MLLELPLIVIKNFKKFTVVIVLSNVTHWKGKKLKNVKKIFSQKVEAQSMGAQSIGVQSVGVQSVERKILGAQSVGAQSVGAQSGYNP